MEGVEIKNADAIEAFRSISTESVDLIIADPPYNLGKDYGNGSDSKTHEDYLRFSQAWLSECKRVLRPTGTIYVFMGVRFISHIFQLMESLALNFNSWICWHYTQGLGKTRGFSPRHDDILMFTKSDSFKFNLDAVRVPQKYYRERNNMRGANPGDVWTFSHIHYSHPNRQPHPTQKPEGLIERMVLASTDPKDFVIDPFAGSGTVARVCQQLQRKSLSIELNPVYVDLITERLRKPFEGFDSIDPRMERVPLDLRQPDVRAEYFENHKQWFLKNHQNAITKFESSAKAIYGRESVRGFSQTDMFLEED